MKRTLGSASRAATMLLMLLTMLLSSCSSPAVDQSKTESTGIAQAVVERGPVTLRVEVAPSPARLSDEPVLTLTIEADAGVRVEPPPFGDGIGDVLIRDFREPLPEIRQGREVTQQIYTLEPIQTGTLTIDPISVAFYDERTQGDGELHRVETEPLEIQIDSVVQADRVSLDNLDAMTDPVGVEGPVSSLVIWTVGGVLFCIACGLLWWWRKPHVQTARQLTPYERAVQELARLEDEGLSRTDVKLFYVELTGIVRRYIEGTTSVQAAEQTTEEFLREISTSQHFAPQRRDRLRGFLESADLVKFAAHQPGRSDVSEALGRARDFVQPPAEELVA